MSGDKNPNDGTSLPEDIAAEAGLPRAADVGHSLHDVGERVGHEAQAGLRSVRDEANEALGRAHDHAQSAGRSAAEAASDFADESSDTARSVGGRMRAAASDARDHAFDAYDDVRSWAADRYDAQRGRAADFAHRGSRRWHDGRSAAEDFVSDNPLLVGVVGLAAGLLLGAMLPRTRHENETLGPWADDVRDQGLRYAREATQQGRAFVERALDPDRLDEAVERATGEANYRGPERTAHRL